MMWKRCAVAAAGVLVGYCACSIIYFMNFRDRIYQRHYAGPGSSSSGWGDPYQGVGVLAFPSNEIINPWDRRMLVLTTGGIVVYDCAVRIWSGGKLAAVGYFADDLNAEAALAERHAAARIAASILDEINERNDEPVEVIEIDLPIVESPADP